MTAGAAPPPSVPFAMSEKDHETRPRRWKNQGRNCDERQFSDEGLYLKNPKATKEAFADGWFHSGDLGAKNPDGYVEIKDRSKDTIIYGGENISSLEVENVLYRWWLGQMRAGASHLAQMPAYRVSKSRVWTPAKNSDREDSEASPQGQGKRDGTYQGEQVIAGDKAFLAVDQFVL